ncbi:MAG: Smr/MutS family protein [Pseudomonadota bacterium]
MNRKRGLSDTDEQIWDEVKKTVDPLHSKPAKHATKKTNAPAPAPIQYSASVKPRQKPVEQKTDQNTRAVRTVSNMDRRTFDRLRRGKTPIDYTIDLHGMTVERARRYLTETVLLEHRRGSRLVLVITGKGTKTTVDEFNRPRAGVLRTSMPDWCATSPLESVVLQVVQAHQKHGGAGAYYVYLRRAR